MSDPGVVVVAPGVLTLWPNTGSGGLAQHAPIGDTPNWKCVDETPTDDDATYVDNAGPTLLLTDRYGLTDPPAGLFSAVINSVTVYIRCRSTGLGTTETAATHIRTSATAYFGIANPLTVGFVNYSTPYLVDPFTLVAWTWAAITALQAGVQTNTVLSDARCTTVWVEVAYG